MNVKHVTKNMHQKGLFHRQNPLILPIIKILLIGINSAYNYHCKTHKA